MNLLALALIGWLGSARLVEAQASGPATPGAIRLLEGYQHETFQGIDTQVGRLWKNGGPEVHYDIGALAGNHARQTEMRRWSKRQTVGANSFTLTMRTDDSLVLTFDKNTANFFIRGIRTQEELAEVLLMLLTYNP